MLHLQGGFDNPSSSDEIVVPSSEPEDVEVPPCTSEARSSQVSLDTYSWILVTMHERKPKEPLDKPVWR